MVRKSPRKRQRRPPAAPSSRVAVPPSDTSVAVQSWLAAAACALVVARPLYPSEAVAQGIGLPAVMLWLLLLVVWLVLLLGRPRAEVHFSWFDAGVLALVGWHTASGLWAASTASARPALNALWEWIGFAVCYLLIRQLFHRPKEARALVVVMIALAVFLSGYGLYQYAYEFPQTRALYEQDPDAALRAAGMWLEPGSRERQLFVQRLESTEPLATFALANSLAGFLTPWLLAALGILLAAIGLRQSEPTHWSVWIAAVGAAAICGICLLLTKSRSAFLASLIGTVALLAYCRPPGWRVGWKVPLAIAAVVLLLVAAALALGGLDLKVLAEAPKSLGYRIQYWQATWRMIADRPLLGCGPGNFQYTYTAYMLPEASEEIADPHNFLLEVWATAGTPAVLALVGLLGAFFWRSLRPLARRCTQPNQTLRNCPENRQQPPADERPRPDRPWAVYAGGAAGLLLAVPLGSIGSVPPAWSVYLAGLPPALFVAAMFWPWVQRGTIPRTLPAVAAGALLVNLAAAGGIGFPGIAQSFWLLLALGINITDDRHRPVPRGNLLIALGIVLLIAVAFFVSAYQPVLACRVKMQRALGDPRRAEQHLQAAAAADPFDANPARALAEFYLHEYLRFRRPGSLERFRHWCEQLLRRCPNSSAAYGEVGGWYWRLYSVAGNPAFARDAAAAFSQAVAHYPTNAVFCAQHALALAAAGEWPKAATAAEKALRLDRLTPHADKKLPDRLKAQVERLMPTADKAPSTGLY